MSDLPGIVRPLQRPDIRRVLEAAHETVDEATHFLAGYEYTSGKAAKRWAGLNRIKGHRTIGPVLVDGKTMAVTVVKR